MAKLEESVLLPVVLYDGDCEMDVGTINIPLTLDFKKFQKTLKQTFGVSNNVTVYLVLSNRSKSASKRRKVLITGNVNLSALVREIRNCYFRVVLKPSRRKKQNILTVPPCYLIQFPPIPLHLIHRQISYGYHYRVRCFHMMNVNVKNRVLNASFPKVDQSGRSRALCKDCTEVEKEGKEASFHLCVYDEVVAGGFRSTAGPISRPR